MLHFPVLRWGEPYQSLEVERVHHFETGEPIAEVSQANGGLVQRDLRKLDRARDALRAIPSDELLAMCAKAADLFLSGDLPLGDTTQSADDFVRCQSATTGLPEHMARMNMHKLHHVLTNLDAILGSLMRGLDLGILARGHGVEGGVPRSYQATTSALGIVLPSNSPGVHGLWLPVIPLQVGLVMKPGSSEPWTPWRMAQAMFAAGVPKEAIAIYPGGHDAGGTIMNHVPRSLIFGSTETVNRYRANPNIRVHGPGFSKILLGDDVVDDWERWIDLIVDSVLVNGGRGCINCSGVWASRHTREIADALAARLGPIAPKPHDDPDAALAAFTTPGQAAAVDADIDAALDAPGVEDVTARYRDGDRLVAKERCDYLRPTVVHSTSPDTAIASKEYMFPFTAVVECPQARMIDAIGDTLVATAITGDDAWSRALLDAPHIDRLNIGPIPTTKLDWMQPHEGNIVEFLYRARAYQAAPLG